MILAREDFFKGKKGSKPALVSIFHNDMKLRGYNKYDFFSPQAAELPQCYVPPPSSPPPAYGEASKFPPLIREKVAEQEREMGKYHRGNQVRDVFHKRNEENKKKGRKDILFYNNNSTTSFVSIPLLEIFLFQIVFYFFS